MGGVSQSARFALNLRQPPAPGNWLVSEINLDSLLADPHRSREARKLFVHVERRSAIEIGQAISGPVGRGVDRETAEKQSRDRREKNEPQRRRDRSVGFARNPTCTEDREE